MAPSARKLARSLMNRTVNPVLARTPRGLGPTSLQRRSTNARVERARGLMRESPDKALQLLQEEIASTEASTAVYRMAARAAYKADRRLVAAEYDERAMDQGYAKMSDLLRLYRYAVAKDQADLRQRAEAAILVNKPDSQGEVERLANTLRRVDADTLFALAAQVQSSAPDLDVRPILLAAHENVVATAPADGRGKAVEALLDTDPSAHGRVIRGLVRARAWNDVQRFTNELAPRFRHGVSCGTWIHLARRSSVSGWTELAATAAQLALETGGELSNADVLIAQGEDLQTVLAHGWDYPQASSEPAYEPQRGSALSVLGQSLPIRSGGYATRSHGILTGLVNEGWQMTAATRLGFPYDLWWKADDERPLEPVDVVDGIPYHRILKDGVRHYPRNPLQPYIADGAAGIAKVATEVRAELIHASSLYDVGMAGLTAARQLGIPFVYEMRGLKQLLEDARIPDFDGSPQSQYLDVLEASIATSADAVLVITQALGHRMVELGVDPDKITVVPNGVHVDRFTPRGRDASLAQELGVEGKTVIGYAGGLVIYEGLNLLFEAAATLKMSRSDFHLLIVGDGAHEKALRNQVAQLGIEDVVTFTGRVPHEEIERYLSLIDITPFPRLPLPVCELISPIKPFEAMAMQKAVVVSDVAALTEIVHDGATGRAFTKGDSADLARVLTELIDDPQERQRLGDQARVWVQENRDWSTITKSVDQVYTSLLGHRGTQ